ncbi:GntR family transcriptional regulator [Streptomyces spiramyceticus]|uniref:GntR family transcriptional regulator n=1 Tax=Streptomyces spiramyceticus TaxID=299717 RepID=UPI00237C020B|nr:GntR family transcriptional regulator [Streptomyces spiramyceticus]
MSTTSEQTTDRRPLHERVAADLRDEILSGVVFPGTVLSAAELRRRYATSSATLNQALELLGEERLVTRRADTAEAPDTVVLKHRQRTMRPSRSVAPSDPGQPYRWITEARKRGVRANSTLLEVKVVPEAPAHVARALGLDAGSPVLLRSQVLTFDDEPAGLVKAYFPLEIVRGTAMMEHRKIRGGISTLLTQLGYPPCRCVDSVSARIPTQEQHALLRLPGNVPVLRTFRVVYSDNDRPVEVHDTVEAGHLYELQYEFSQAQ